VILRSLAANRWLVRSSAIVFAGNSIARLLGFLFSIVAARILAAQQYGTLAVGLAVASIAAILVANAPRGLSRFLARHDGDRRQQDDFFSNWLVVVALTLGVSAVLVAPISTLAGLRGWMVLAVGANLLGVAVFETYRESQRGLRQFGAMVLFYLTANLLQLLAILVAGSLGWRSPPLFLTIYGLSSLAVLLIAQLIRPIALSFRPRLLTRSRVSWIVRFVRPLVLQTVFYAVWSGADIVLVGRLLGPVATGNYAAARTLVTVLALAPLAIAIVIGPEVARLSLHGLQDVRRFVSLALLFTAAVSVPVAVGLVWFREPIIVFLFGSDYPFASRPLPALAFGMTLFALFLVFESLWVGLGQPRIVAISSGVAMVCTVSLALVLIPRIADLGAAYAYAAGSAAQLAIIGLFTAWKLYSGSATRTEILKDHGMPES
jgi:O-antigen/teichoic acid export membrane protein